MQKSHKELAHKLSQSDFVSLTIDGWSSRRLLSMLGVIVEQNFMDTSGGKLKVELLGIKIFKGSLTGKNNSQFVMEMAREGYYRQNCQN